MKRCSTLIVLILFASSVTSQETFRTSLGMPNQSHGGTSGVITESEDQVMVMTDQINTKICSISPEGDMNWSLSSPNGANLTQAGYIIKLTNGNMVATTLDNVANEHNLVCLSENGDVIWEKHTSDWHFISHITALSNGTFALVGINLLGQSYTACFSADGTLLWSKEIINPASVALNFSDIRESATAGVLINYYTWDNSNSPCSGWMELSADGDFMWEKLYPVGPDEYRYSGSELASDGNYYYVGALIPVEGYQFADLLITKLSPQGELLGHKVFADLYTDEARDIVETDDGNLLLVGTTKPTWPCGGNTFVAKINYELDSIFTRNYGDASGDLFGFFWSLQKENDAIYAFGNGGLTNGVGNSDAHIIKTNQNFDLSCSIFAWPLETYEPEVQLEADIEVYTTEFEWELTDSDVFFPSEIQLVRICESDPVSVPTLDQPTMSLYPNPTEGLFFISGMTSNEHIEVFDSSGRMVLSTYYVPTGIDVSQLTSGIYSVKFGAKDQRILRLVIR
jgi:hypothetical protein